MPYVKNLFGGEKELLECDIAFICNPTHLHIHNALYYASCGMHLFIEKPIDNKLNNLNLLIDLINTHSNLTTYVAYPFRFHKDILKIKEQIGAQKIYSASFSCSTYLPNWGKPSYSYCKETGGGALLELSHEIDLAEFFCGRITNIEGRLNRISDITTDCEDQAYLTLKHETGTESKVELDIANISEKRMLDIRSKDYWITYSYKPTQHMFADQIKYFMENLGDPHLMNNLKEASKLFKKIINFKTRTKINC
jgi:predicted dehydrogenase